MRVAYYSPLPPSRSGIADYSSLLLPALERLVEVDVVRPGRTRPVAADVALYHVGNDPDAHGWIVDALRRRPGVVVLHDFVLHHLVAGLTIGRKDGRAYLSAMERDAGVPGRLLAAGVLDARVAPIWETRPDAFPLVGEVLDPATGLIVHSRFVEERVRETGYDGPMWRIPHPAWPVPAVEPAHDVAGSPLFGCFGHINANKRIPQLLEAFESVRARHPGARLLLVGPTSPRFDDERLGGEDVERIDYVDEERLWSLMAACDVCVSLRFPTMGETSGSAIRALSLGRPLVASDVGWFSELPDEVALKIDVGDAEVPQLAETLELLASSEAKRHALSAAARAYVEREHEVGEVAGRYAEALEDAAGGGIVADRVVDEVARAAAEVGVVPGGAVAEELTLRLGELGLARNGRPEAAPRPPGRLRRVPIWAWLGALVAVSILVRYALSRRVVAPWIMVDELIYSELGRSFATTGEFLIRGEQHGAYGVVYPILIAPAYRVFAPLTDAYAAAKAIGAVTMSLAAVPAYFLARRVVRPSYALAAAALAVVVPSMAYSSMVMSETVFYPLFLATALALVLALEAPTLVRQLVLLGACALLFLTRSQAIVLVAVLLTAPVVLAWVDRRGRRGLTPFKPLYGAVAAAAVCVLVVQAVRGHSMLDVLGSYNVTGKAHYSVDQVLRWLLFHIAGLDLYLGVAPFAALLLLTATARSLDRPLRVFVAAAVPVTVWLTLEVATFASTWSQRIQERNLFYVAPLFLIALLAWIERGMPRPPRPAAAAALAAAALPAAIPYQRLLDVPSQSDTLALLPLWWLKETALSVDTVAIAVALGALTLAAAFLFLSPRWALALPVVVAAWFVFTTERAEDFEHGFRRASIGALFQGISLPNRDWVDRAVGRDADVAFVFSGRDPTQQPLTLWENEFFNRSVGRVYDLRAPSMGSLPEHKAVVRADGVLVSEGRPVRHPYALTDTSVPLAGTAVAADNRKGIVLLRTDGLVRVAHRVSGLYPNDTWSGPTVTYTRLRCRGGSVTATVTSDPNLFHGPQIIRARGRELVLDPSKTAALTVPLRRTGDVCRVRFTVTPTAIPAVVNGSGDGRVLGAHFLSFAYAPPR